MGKDQSQSPAAAAPLRSAFLPDLFQDMLSNVAEIFHNQSRLTEHVGIDALQSVVQQSTALIESDLVSIIDMSFAAGYRNYIIPIDMKMLSLATRRIPVKNP